MKTPTLTTDWPDALERSAPAPLPDLLQRLGTDPSAAHRGLTTDELHAALAQLETWSAQLETALDVHLDAAGFVPRQVTATGEVSLNGRPYFAAALLPLAGQTVHVRLLPSAAGTRPRVEVVVAGQREPLHARSVVAPLFGSEVAA